MARLSQSLPCPACGEPMKVSKGKISQKVCCPHCRQNVVLEPATENQAEPDWTLPTASLQLQDILTECKNKCLLLETTRKEIADLEAQAHSLARWLQTQGVSPCDEHSTRALADLQARLFEQVQTLKKGHLAILDCDAKNEKSLAHSIQLTFEAFGWSVQLESGLRTPHCGEEITFIVAPGPVNYPVAAVYMALQGSGVRLHSQIDLEQTPEHALLCVHRVSHIPKLLPPPKGQPVKQPDEELKKSA